MLESSARGRNDYLYERFVEPAAAPPWIDFGVKVGPIRSWPDSPFRTPSANASSTAATRETYITKLVRLARRKDSLLMRVDLAGSHDTTYVLGKKLLRIRCRTLN